MYPIEKNVPVPKTIRKRIYPFSEMEVGDSFYVRTGIFGKNPTAVRVAASRSNNGRRFTTRQDAKGVRCWRIQ